MLHYSFSFLFLWIYCYKPAYWVKVLLAAVILFTGGFYQDQMGQVDCKRCSVGTYVSVERHPGTRATDCWACPYGKHYAASWFST